VTPEDALAADPKEMMQTLETMKRMDERKQDNNNNNNRPSSSSSAQGGHNGNYNDNIVMLSSCNPPTLTLHSHYTH
jgi:hypothetical protein